MKKRTSVHASSELEAQIVSLFPGKSEEHDAKTPLKVSSLQLNLFEPSLKCCCFEFVNSSLLCCIVLHLTQLFYEALVR